ncbi:MAG: D-alanine--D-alanine ligase [Succinivibrio sp.]|nr:D-alanine--D-alanine ligase [Succinivibrio sp.]
MSTNILLMCGGDGSEHEISLLSAKFIEEQLKLTKDFNVTKVVIHNHQFMVDDNACGYFDAQGDFVFGDEKIKVDCVVPCIHGIPGETGDIQSFLNIQNIPFIGCDAEASGYCFNKITTKLYFDALGIPNTPYAIIPLKTEQYKTVALEFFDKYKDIYVKAASQGSSVGCYHVTKRDDVWDSIVEAFQYSTEVIIEKNIIHRELEVAAYEIDGELKITNPGEIIIPDNLFYTFEEKYSKNSGTITTVTPENLTSEEIATIRDLARRAFVGLKLRDLSRIDFFLSKEDGILINEINTFPGATPISMFPKMLAHNGDNMADFLAKAVKKAILEKK